MLKGLAAGDVVIVKRINRLARSTFEPVRYRQANCGRQGAILLARGVVGRHQHQHRAADDRRAGRLADVERDLIRTRTAQGRSRAQKRGQHMGRPARLTEAQKAEARRRRAESATLAELACSYDVSKSTISRVTV
jgi:DNA invertase Pin-like site-specific DNA recombinase